MDEIGLQSMTTRWDEPGEVRDNTADGGARVERELADLEKRMKCLYGKRYDRDLMTVFVTNAVRRKVVKVTDIPCFSNPILTEHAFYTDRYVVGVYDRAGVITGTYFMGNGKEG